MIKGFREFLLRGNVVDLAVAVVLGAAFGAVVSAFADDFIGGIIGAIGGSPDFSNAGATVNDSKIVWGSTITALIQFLIVAAAIYFVHAGTLEMQFGDGSSHTLGPGGLARVAPTTVRALRNVSESEDAIYLCVGGADGYVGRDGRPVED